MQRKYTFTSILLVLGFILAGSARLQAQNDTIPGAIDPELEGIPNAKSPKEYIVAGIKITGTKRYDEQLLISIAAINVGDKLTIPGGDNISKAINNLWNQKLFSNIEIYYTKLVGNNLYIEIHVTERPALSKYFFRGARKSDEEDLKRKWALSPATLLPKM